MPLSAFIVRVPEAEPHVAHLRERFDPSARLGVPAHITLLYPFMSPERITEADLEAVRGVAARVPAFGYRLTHIGRFPGCLYLAPDPAEPFVALTTSLCECFPTFPPYEGQHGAVVPHLTVAQAGEAEQHAAETELLSSLPSSGGLAASCSELVLIENSSGRWRPMQVFALAHP